MYGVSVASTSLSFLIGELSHVELEGDVNLVVEPDEFTFVGGSDKSKHAYGTRIRPCRCRLQG